MIVASVLDIARTKLLSGVCPPRQVKENPGATKFLLAEHCKQHARCVIAAIKNLGGAPQKPPTLFKRKP